MKNLYKVDPLIQSESNDYGGILRCFLEALRIISYNVC
jgi:hypothetical protein